MSIGEEVKQILEERQILVKKIYDNFKESLADMERNGLVVRPVFEEGALAANVESCRMCIPVMKVVSELKGNGNKEIKDITDQAIKNTINRMIKESVSI